MLYIILQEENIINPIFLILIQYWYIFLIIGLINIALAVYVYNDAKKCGLNRGNWATLVIFTGCCGLNIYFMAKPTKEIKKSVKKPRSICPVCKQKIPEGVKKCPICYSKIEIIGEEHVKIYQDSPKKTDVKKTYVTRIIDFRCPVCKSNVPDSEAEKCPICKSKIKGIIQVKKEIWDEKGHKVNLSSTREKSNNEEMAKFFLSCGFLLFGIIGGIILGADGGFGSAIIGFFLGLVVFLFCVLTNGGCFRNL